MFGRLALNQRRRSRGVWLYLSPSSEKSFSSLQQRQDKSESGEFTLYILESGHFLDSGAQEEQTGCHVGQEVFNPKGLGGCPPSLHGSS